MQILAEQVKECKGDFHENDSNRKAVFEIGGSPSSSTPTAPFSPLSLIETISRKSFSYTKLPLEPIKLTVLKLDGSSFDITVEQKATVAKLKQAIEAAFSHLPKHGIGSVSWPHVWGQFCLRFEGQKLLNDNDSIRLYGIQDGVQLQFVRHTSISYNLVKERSEKQDFDSNEPKTSPSKSDLYRQKKSDKNDNLSRHKKDNAKQQDPNEKEKGRIHGIGVDVTCEWSLARLLRRLFSYHNLRGCDGSYEEIGGSSSLNMACNKSSSFKP